MKNFFYLLCVLSLLCACGKKDEQNAQPQENQIITQKQYSENMAATDKTNKKNTAVNPEEFLRQFAKYNDAQKYYFCAAFAMGAMSVSKPITASAMVNYFMGLGAVKYNVGINDETYPAFNAGKNSFTSEILVNTILQKHICEDIMNEAADFAKDKKYNVADLDKRGKVEVARVVEYIKKQNK